MYREVYDLERLPCPGFNQKTTRILFWSVATLSTLAVLESDELNSAANNTTPQVLMNIQGDQIMAVRICFENELTETRSGEFRTFFGVNELPVMLTILMFPRFGVSDTRNGNKVRIAAHRQSQQLN